MAKIIIPETTLDDLSNCDYANVIAASESDMHQYCMALSRAAEDAAVKKETSKENALRFLSVACSLMLRPSDLKTPFVPLVVYVDKTTSATISDFSKAQSVLLREFVPKVQDAELAARLADLSWVIQQCGNAGMAKTAINNYIEASNSAYCHKHWAQRLKRLERALRLALSIKEITLVEAIKAELFALLEPEHKLYSLIATKSIYSLLLELKLMEPIIMGEKIEATIVSQSGNCEFQHDLLCIAAKAFLKANNAERANDAKVKAAEFLAKKAELSKQPGQMLVASHFFSQAIAAFQKCKGQQERVTELQREIIAVTVESQKEMYQFSSAMNIADSFQKAISVMQNKDLRSSILQFACLISPISRKKLEDEAIAIANQTVFQSTTAKRIQNSDGRLIVVIPPLLGSEGEDYDLALRWAAYRQALFCQSFAVQAIILPARHELLNLHQVDKRALTEILQHCLFFPLDRVHSWVKGFVAGFDGDFEVALSLLIPQFEHALRKCLESRGTTVWRVDPATQCHSEKTLGDMLGMDEARDLLGEDLRFELQGLLTEKVAFNLRNEFGHGLMSESDFSSVSGIYLWWLLFRIAILGIDHASYQLQLVVVKERGDAEAVI